MILHSRGACADFPQIPGELGELALLVRCDLNIGRAHCPQREEVVLIVAIRLPGQLLHAVAFTAQSINSPLIGIGGISVWPNSPLTRPRARCRHPNTELTRQLTLDRLGRRRHLACNQLTGDEVHVVSASGDQPRDGQSPGRIETMACGNEAPGGLPSGHATGECRNSNRPSTIRARGEGD